MQVHTVIIIYSILYNIRQLTNPHFMWLECGWRIDDCERILCFIFDDDVYGHNIRLYVSLQSAICKQTVDAYGLSLMHICITWSRHLQPSGTPNTCNMQYVIQCRLRYGHYMPFTLSNTHLHTHMGDASAWSVRCAPWRRPFQLTRNCSIFRHAIRGTVFH